MTFRPHHKFHSMSLSGYYAIALENTDPRVTRYAAISIPGLWAEPVQIGVRNTPGEAEQLCEQHSLTPDFSHLATGV
jgi:hypothetical protein